MPRSRVDYATDQITVYRYCPYGCRYCYVWRSGLFASRVVRGKYDPVEEARKYLHRKDRIVVVSFVSDPYPPEEEDKRITRRVLEILCNTGNRVMVLTKNPRLALRLDEDLFTRCNNVWLGSTVVTLDSRARVLEPFAPDPLTRITELKILHSKGGHTWLSIEPIIPGVTYPEQIVAETLEYVDWYVLGAFNYSKALAGIGEGVLRSWYRDHVAKALKILRAENKPFHVKKELRRLLGAVEE